VQLQIKIENSSPNELNLWIKRRKIMAEKKLECVDDEFKDEFIICLAYTDA